MLRVLFALFAAAAAGAVAAATSPDSHLAVKNSSRVVAWYFGKYPKYPPEDIDFRQPGGVTHLLFTGLNVETNSSKPTFGTVGTCNRSTWSPVMQRAYNLAKQAGAKVQFMFPTDDAGVSLLEQLSNASSKTTARANFIGSLKAGLDSCDMDGFEVDWEGPSTQEMADGFLEMLIEARHKLGASKYALSFDTEPPQWLPGDYFKPNPKIYFDQDNFGDLEHGGNNDANAAELFVNFMTYFQTQDSASVDEMISYYETSMQSAIDQKYPLNVVTIAVPYYQQTGGENEWSIVCGACKDLAYEENFCGGQEKGFNIVGKKANYEIGKRVRTLGLGGVFPWVLDYDVSANDTTTCGDNNLFKWLKKGLSEDGHAHVDETIQFQI